MPITITIEGADAIHARQQMHLLLNGPTAKDFTWTRVEEPAARTVVMEPEPVETETTEAPEPVAEAQPKKRGRPRKEPVAIGDVLGQSSSSDPGENTPVVIGDVLGQIDLEDVIAAQAEERIDSEALAEHVAMSAEMIDEAPQPENPEAGWTTQDARNAGKALLDRAPDVESGNRRLAAVLETFGVKQVKALSPDQIEAFVIATTKAVF